MKDTQIKEALERMEMLGLSSQCISAFKKGKVWESEGMGALYEVNEREQGFIDKFQNDHKGCLVYHMIHNFFEFGEVYSMLGLYDVIQRYIQEGYIIQTKAIGLAASAAALILLSGSKGYRSMSPHSKVMIHQPSSSTYGTITDMKIDLEENLRIKEELNEIIKKHSGQDLSNLMERNKWLTPEEALSYGLIDKVS